MDQPPPSETVEPGTVRRIPLRPEAMTEPLTPLRDLFLLAHLGVRRPVAPEAWTLRVEGLVERPLRLGSAELAALPRTTFHAVHQCAGNPLEPTVPTRRVACVAWEGVRLSEVLALAKPHAAAAFLWSDGADGGTFAGAEVPFYRKDLPLARVREDALLVVGVNGAPLPADHGGPLRLVVPGWFGTNSVKWLWRLTLADRRADGPFTTRWYNDALPDGGTAPVWGLLPEAVTVRPAPGPLPAGRAALHGWAWSDAPVAVVTVSGDGGATWQPARLAPREGRGWQRWDAAWDFTPGPAELLCRATDAQGRTQPLDGARNAVHRVALTVLPG